MPLRKIMAAPLTRRVAIIASQCSRQLQSLSVPLSHKASFGREPLKTPLIERCRTPVTVISPARVFCSSGHEAEDDIIDDDLYKEMIVEVKGHDKEVINSYETFVTMAARELEIKLSKVWTPPRVIERYTLLKSVHIYKKHRVQYETRTLFRTFEFQHLTGSTADTFLEYIQRNLPEGMAMKVTKRRIERLPEHIHPPVATQSLE